MNTEPNLVLTGATVLAGRSLEPTVADVTLGGESIAAVAAGKASEKIHHIDCSGMTLLPGFIDAHVHISFANPLTVLKRGVTTVRDLAWPLDDIFPLAERSRSVDFDGPEILAAGQMLTAPGGYPMRAAWAPRGTGREVTTVADAAFAVAEQANRGACLIKVALNPPVGPVLNTEVLRAIVDASHAQGLRVTAHVNGLEELRKAIDCGVDELAHMLLGPQEIPDDVIEQMVAAHMAVVPTLSCRFDDLSVGAANLERFWRSGGTVVYGTDLGNEGPRPGIDEREMSGMRMAGMDARSIIASATTDSATYLGLTDRGAIEPGLRADLIGVQGDPLAGLHALQRVALVVRRGRVVA